VRPKSQMSNEIKSPFNQLHPVGRQGGIGYNQGMHSQGDGDYNSRVKRMKWFEKKFRDDGARSREVGYGSSLSASVI
jgi:hypothetical protein